MVYDITRVRNSITPTTGFQWTPGPSPLQVAQGLGAAGMGQSGMEWLQQLLNTLGANPPLAVDGKIGPKTMAAIQNFNQSAGLPQNAPFGLPSLIAAQMMPQTTNIGDWNRQAMMNSTGGEYTPTAPAFDSPTPTGTVRAGDFAREMEARSRTTGPQTPITSPDGSVRVNAPWMSQFDPRVPRAGDTACYRACREMMLRAGVRNFPQGTGNRIQVANSEDGAGRVSTTRGQTDQARNYIDQQLAAGRPVTVGVSHKNANYNQDGITDHFVVITGRGTDAQGRTFYTYNDPATRNEGTGTSQRFYVNPTTGNLVHEGPTASGYVVNRHTELSMVIRNP